MRGMLLWVAAVALSLGRWLLEAAGRCLLVSSLLRGSSVIARAGRGDMALRRRGRERA